MEEELLNRILTKVVDMDATIRDVRDGMATKEDFQSVRNEMAEYVDGFVKLHTTLDVEHLALCTRVDRLEDRIENLEDDIDIASA